MLAYVVCSDSEKPTGLQTVAVPTAGPKEALVRVLRAGVCNTDLEICKGYMGFQGVLGHEFVGVVEALGAECADDGADTVRDLIGKRVVGDINVACRDFEGCATCARRDATARNHCPTRTVLGILNKDGTYAEYLTLPTANLHVVPDAMTSATALFVEPLAAACRVVEQGLVAHGDRVAIIGDGKLGLLVAEVMGRQRLAARPVLFYRHAWKAKFVEDVVDTHLSPPGQRFFRSFDVVVDATGSPSGLEAARTLVVPTGTIVLKSTCAAGAGFNAAPFVIDELRIVGSRCGPFDAALALLSEDGTANSVPRLDVEKYVTNTFPLKQADEALAAAQAKDTMKVQIICAEE